MRFKFNPLFSSLIFSWHIVRWGINSLDITPVILRSDVSLRSSITRHIQEYFDIFSKKM